MAYYVGLIGKPFFSLLVYFYYSEPKLAGKSLPLEILETRLKRTEIM
jgi:hypothetical protein